MGQAIIVELVQVGTGRLADVYPRFRAHLPAPVHPPGAEAGVAPAVTQTDFQVGAGIHHATKDEGGKSNRPVHQVADGVVQVIAGVPVAHQGLAALLVHQHHRAHLFRRLPQGQKLRVVVGIAVNVVVNHGADEAHSVDTPVQFGDSQVYILHRNNRHALETVGVVHGHLIHFVVALPVHGGNDLGVPVVVVVKAKGGDHVNIHAQGVHIVDTLLRRPGVAGADAHFPGLDTVPLPAFPHGPDETLGRQMSVYVYAAHLYLRIG